MKSTHSRAVHHAVFCVVHKLCRWDKSTGTGNGSECDDWATLSAEHRVPEQFCTWKLLCSASFHHQHISIYCTRESGDNAQRKCCLEVHADRFLIHLPRPSRECNYLRPSSLPLIVVIATRIHREKKHQKQYFDERFPCRFAKSQ